MVEIDSLDVVEERSDLFCTHTFISATVRMNVMWRLMRPWRDWLCDRECDHRYDHWLATDWPLTTNANRDAIAYTIVETFAEATDDATAHATAHATGDATVDATIDATVDATAYATVDAIANATVDAIANATISATSDTTDVSIIRSTSDFTVCATTTVRPLNEKCYNL